MARREILQYPDPSLRTVCDRVEVYDDALRRLAADLLDTMYLAGGRGLAAPQIGVDVQLFVMDPGWKSGIQTPFVCANPFVASLGDETCEREEVCLSIPDRPTLVSRPARVLLHWHDGDGVAHEVELDGDAAAIAQHEADHLEGRLVIDYARDAE